MLPLQKHSGMVRTKSPHAVQNRQKNSKKNKVGYLVVPELSECVYNLVAKAWLAECEQYKPGMQIHHITDDGYDNRPENLIVLDEDIHRQMPRCGVKDDDYWPGKYDKK